MFVLRPKSVEVRDTDEWAGKVKAVVKGVNEKIDDKIEGVNDKIEGVKVKCTGDTLK